MEGDAVEALADPVKVRALVWDTDPEHAARMYGPPD